MPDRFERVSLCNAAVVELGKLDVLLAAEREHLANFTTRCEEIAGGRIGGWNESLERP